jgi:hypothetical protein
MKKKPRRRKSFVGPMHHGISLPQDLWLQLEAVGRVERNSPQVILRRLVARGLLLDERLLDAGREAAGGE